MATRIATVTLNPALDMTGNLSELQAGGVNLVSQSSLHAAGKGVNVARVLSDLGAQVTVTGFLGDDNQDPFAHLFQERGIDDKFLRIPGVSRTNVKLVDRHGAVTDINFPGMTTTSGQREQLSVLLQQLAANHDVFVIAGSLPLGFEPDQLKEWIYRLTDAGKRVMFDSSQTALQVGCEGKPWLTKPNEYELAQCLGLPASNDQTELCKRGEQLARTGIENIVISRGADGVLWRDHQGWLKAVPPSMAVTSTVGAGDSLVAGICWGTVQQWDKERTLRFATALSALAVTQIGVGVEDIEQVNQVATQVVIEAIESTGSLDK